MLRLYTILLRLLTPLVMLRLSWKGLRNRGYWLRWHERFGFFATENKVKSIWVHAVSVGEFQAIIPFIKNLQKRFPEYPLVITTMTPTGSSRVLATFGDQVFHVYLPYDLPGSVSRFLDKVNPEIAIIMETEIWPNLFSQCSNRGIPLIIANARLSVHSMQGYQRFSRLLSTTLAQVKCIATQSELDARRFLELGAEKEQVHTMGNIKFDLEVNSNLAQESAELRRHLGQNRFILIAASTHEGEETQILEAFSTIRQTIANCLLVLVPRHPERFSHVATMCTRRGFSLIRRSQGLSCETHTDIYLGDTLGELLLMYGAADVAFIGGSLVPVGGHNMLEAAALEKPLLTGPHLSNFTEISQKLLSNQAMLMVETPQALAKAVVQLAQDEPSRRQMGANGKRIIDENKGAVNQLLGLVERHLTQSQAAEETT